MITKTGLRCRHYVERKDKQRIDALHPLFENFNLSAVKWVSTVKLGNFLSAFDAMLQ